MILMKMKKTIPTRMTNITLMRITKMKRLQQNGFEDTISGRGLPEALASLPSTIKVSLVSETEEDRLRREEREREQIAKRRDAYRKQMAENVAKSLEKGKRKFGDRMNLEEASRDD